MFLALHTPLYTTVRSSDILHFEHLPIEFREDVSPVHAALISVGGLLKNKYNTEFLDSQLPVDNSCTPNFYRSNLQAASEGKKIQ